MKVSSFIAYSEETTARHDAPSDVVVEPLSSSQNACPNVVHEQQGNAVSGLLNVAFRYDSVQSTTRSYADHQVKDIMKWMTDQMHINRVQILESGIFSDFLQYPSWKFAFDILVDGRDIPQNEKIYYLK